MSHSLSALRLVGSGSSTPPHDRLTNDLSRQRYAEDSGRVLLSGVQALVRLPMLQMRLDRAAGRRTATLISGYEGSPLAGYDLELHRVRGLLDQLGVTFQPAVNEELAATAIGGSQLVPGRPAANVDGVVGLWYGKAPGLDRATDAIRHGNMQGADHRGGALLLVGDDPATKSSSLPSASEGILIDLNVPVLYPGNVAEVIDYGLYGIALSRLTGLWTSLKIVVGVADATASVDLTLDGRLQELVRLAADASGLAADRHVATPLMSNPVRLRLERDLVTKRLATAHDVMRRYPLDRVEGAGAGARVAIVAAGKTYFDMRQALKNRGVADDDLAALGLRLIKVGALFPNSSSKWRELLAGAERVVVVEEKRPTLEAMIKESLYGSGTAPEVIGKRDRDGNEVFPAYGELDADVIGRHLAVQLKELIPRLDIPSGGGRARPSLTLTPVDAPARTPHFCSGCPHSRSTKVPDGSLVGAGIGCHAMITRSSRDDLGDLLGLTQMGGEGGQWIGLEPFVEDAHSFQNLGDGTLTHSGTLAIRAAVAARSHITYKILYNSAVAMTGGQEPAGVITVPSLAHLLRAEGVARVIITTEAPRSYRKRDLPKGTSVWDASRILEAQEVLRDTAGVTVLIHDQECAAELRRKRRRGKIETPTARILINDRVCEGCGDCGQKSNCLSVTPLDTPFGDKTQIHQESCNFDYACVQGHCPSFLSIEVDPRHGSSDLPDLHEDVLPEPELRQRSEFAMRLTGIGGTGIVTAAQVVGMAGLLDGWDVKGLDQTGLAQKGGPVVSDLKLSKGHPDGSTKLSQGECDLYVVADVLTGIDPSNLAVASASRTAAVVSTSEVTPGSMIGKPLRKFPEASTTLRAVEAVTVPGELISFDAVAISNRLFDNDASANMILLGAAYQSGHLPVPATSLEEAIRINGVSIAANIQAFRRGRQLVHAPQDVARVLDPGRAPAHGVKGIVARGPVDDLIQSVRSPSDGLVELLAERVPELIAYQDRPWAMKYLGAVSTARESELRAELSTGEFSEAVARYLYKLMAYKDEYEVARLHLQVLNSSYVEDRLGHAGRTYVYLLPPTLARFGLRRKLKLGPSIKPALRVIYSARRLRGTRWDPFGRHDIRRIERQLIDEYMELIEGVGSQLAASTLRDAVALASAPDLIRGYDHVKLESLERYRARLAEIIRDK